MIGRCTSTNGVTPTSHIMPMTTRGDSQVGGHGAEPGLQGAAHRSARQPVLHEEQIGGTQPEHDDGVAVEPIAQPTPARQGEVLPHGQRVDIADAALLEIARAGVVDGVAATPGVVGRQRQRADDAAHPVVESSAAEESTMAAIVLDHEQADEEAGCRDRQQQAQPVAKAQSHPHQHPQSSEGPGGQRQLEHAADLARLTIAGKDLHPVACGADRDGVVCISQGSDPFLVGREREPHRRGWLL